MSVPFGGPTGPNVRAVVGAQYGDEGKGRIVDWLAQKADMVIRYQGGDNAGHTVMNQHGTFALHMIPSGVFNPTTMNIVGQGCVVNPDNAIAEIETLRRKGVWCRNVRFDRRAHIVMPWHVQLDKLQEEKRSPGAKIGTTGRGIGPCYRDKVNRTGMRLGDLCDIETFKRRLSEVLPAINDELTMLDGITYTVAQIVKMARVWRKALHKIIIDAQPMIMAAVTGGKSVLLEGQLGAMRGIDSGIYPYVTSSETTAGGACAGAGIPPCVITYVLGIAKCYNTAVGKGPFPTADTSEAGIRLQELGKEFGATTGRKRDCGWFDAVAIRQAAWLNGFTGIAITKLDILDTFEKVKICTGYQLGDKVLDYVPDTWTLEKCTPIYEEWDGWMTSTQDVRSWDELPKAARLFLRRIAELVGVKIEFISVGAEREQLIVM